MSDEDTPTLDLGQEVNTKLDESGVTAITKGTVVLSQLCVQFRALLKAAAPKRYDAYREIKYPGGLTENATAETKLAATRYLFDAVRDLLSPHYVSAT